MHEYTIVQSLIESCEEHVSENNAKKVTQVILKIGVLSGIEIDQLQIAFDTFKSNTVCDEAQLVINIQKIKILCKNCNNEQELETNEFHCPKCKSFELKVLDGEEMFLMSLELE